MSGLSDTDAAPEPQQLGCPKCRYAQRGCKQCRRPGYQRRPRPSKAPAAEPLEGSRKRKVTSQAQVTEEPTSSGAVAKQTRAGAAKRSAGDTQPDESGKKRQPARKRQAAPADTTGHTKRLKKQLRKGVKLAAASASAVKLGDHPAAEGAQHSGTPARNANLEGEALTPVIKAASSLSDEERRANFSNALRANMAARQGARASTSPAASAQAPAASGRPDTSVEKPKKQRKRVKVVLRRQVVEGNPRVALWEPPPSPFGLIEELLYQDPWRLLLACMLLNKTSGIQPFDCKVRKVLWNLFALIPTAEAAAEADVKAIEAIIYPLGLFRKRAIMVKRFSQEYVEQDWHDPLDLHGIGQYAADAYFIFCRGDWRHRLPPADKDLLNQKQQVCMQWLHETDGQGMGLEREQPPVPVPAAIEEANLNVPEIVDVSQQTGEVVELRP